MAKMSVVATILFPIIANGNAAANGFTTLHNSEFAFSARLPAGYRVCKVKDQDKEIGFYIWLKNPMTACDDGMSNKGPFINVYAAYNSSFQRDVRSINARYCNGPPIDKKTTDTIKSISFKGHVSSVCGMYAAGDMVEVVASTVAGSWPDAEDEDSRYSKRIYYNATLRTSRKNFDNDIVLFKDFVRRVSISLQ